MMKRTTYTTNLLSDQRFFWAFPHLRRGRAFRYIFLLFSLIIAPLRTSPLGITRAGVFTPYSNNKKDAASIPNANESLKKQTLAWLFKQIEFVPLCRDRGAFLRGNVFVFGKDKGDCMVILKTNWYKITLLLAVIAMGIQILPVKAQHKQTSNLEKIYTQTDRPFYFPGETIWFKSYIVGEDHNISTLSDVMYAELISPRGSSVKSIKLSVNQGYAYGDFTIEEDWVGGMYTLKMFTNWMRNYGEKAFFTKKIIVQKVVKPKLLLSLNFEKEGYGKSSFVTANFEAKDLKNNPLHNTEVSYAVAARGKTILSDKIATDAKGKAAINFQLPDDLTTRDVVLNVLVPHKATAESISRSVPVVLDNIDLQFFPESGKLISGTTNNVAFKAINEFGKPVDVQGDIINSSGIIIASFNSFHDGMGAFQLQPDSNEKYYAKIKVPFVSGRQIPLPKIHKEGVNFRVTTDSLKTSLNIHSTYSKPLFLEVFNDGMVLLKEKIKTGQGEITINSGEFPVGITRFRLTDKNQNPLAERLVFMNPKKQLNIDVRLDKETYRIREKVKVTITTKDKDNNPVPANLSVAVADNKLLSFADDKQDHILSYLLLSSELKGKIHKPGFYFNPEESKSYLALDYVMLTHGWRDYIYTPVAIEAAPYQPDRLAVQSGKIVDKKGNPVKATLLLFDRNGNKVLVFESDEKGNFSFKFDKGQTLTLIAYTKDRRKLAIIDSERTRANLNNASPIINDDKGKIVVDEAKDPSKYNKPTNRVIKKKATASVALSEDSSALEEVVVVAHGYETRRNLVGSAVVSINRKVLAGHRSVAQALQGGATGVKIVNGSGIYGSSSSTVAIRGVASVSGNNQPLVIIDGVPYNQDILSHLNTDEIDAVTILKDAPATALYGSAAANGVVIVTTNSYSFYNNYGKKKLNNARYNNYTIKTFYNNQPAGLYYSRQFYMPEYEGDELPEERADFRQTIYWNPVVQTDENGKAEFEFYNSDAITSFKIITEGIGYNGLAGRQEKAYATKKLLNLEVKLPNYMVINDTINMPVTITNETDKKIEARLNVALPASIRSEEALNMDVTVNANSTIVKNVKIIPVKQTDRATIELRLKSNRFSDAVKRGITVLSPYFPTEVSLSGARSQSFTCQVDHVVNDSINADFTIYTDIIGDVMDGIEGLIRQPNGCFEQASSATYPNIMILQYLKESGKSNPEIEAKAIGFIKKGYKRLKGFETSQGGFEWFGGTPPHETLTAYGILEFTEMKEVYDGVSQKMIDRTVQWLLSRRDGKGGFKKSKKGYDSFAGSPKDVANAYIIYALSEANVKANIEPEYTAAYNDAVTTNDTYKMALLALASDNVNKPQNANVLIGKIKRNIAAYGFDKLPVANTITRSYGNSKNIETAAFSILALMRAPNPENATISRGIEYVVSKRKYGRFGSTQATAMALKALIEYTKSQKHKLITQNNTVTLTINGKKLNRKLSSSENGKIVIDSLETYIKEGTQNIQVEFSDDKTTFPYALNISYDSFLPESSKNAPLVLETIISDKPYGVGSNVSMTISVANTKNENLGMVTAIIGIPSGASAQPWQLKELLEQNNVAYYEVFDNYLVFYWRAFDALETKTIRLDLKAEIAGTYKAPAGTAYLYYGDEFKTWVSGNRLEIKN